MVLNPGKPDQNLQQLEDFEAARRAEGYREYTWQQLKNGDDCEKLGEESNRSF